MTVIVRILACAFLAVSICGGSQLSADDPTKSSDENGLNSVASNDAGDDQVAFELSDEIRDILSPLFVAIRNADVSRSTIEVLTDSLITGQIVDSKKSTYQIAARSPDKFTIYLKEQSQRTRIYNDGESIVVALAPDAYFRIADSISNSAAVIGLPVPMGPYPEPVLALSLAGVDPATSLASGMKSIELVDEKKFRGEIPAVHLHGVQADAVSWDLWLSKDDPPKPLRMLVDLTPMLLSSKELQLPKGYSHQIRFDFLSWRVSGKVNDALFTFTPAKDSTEYESLEHYNEVIATKMALHPLLGKAAPKFKAPMLDDRQLDSEDLKDKVVVIDFWASWYEPCAVILPVIKQVCDQYADKDVVFLALNIRENEDEIRTFLKKHELDILVAVDSDGAITERFAVETMPQTIVIGKSGNIESVHHGFPGKDELKQRLTDELEVLSVGGRIGSARESGDQTSKTRTTPRDDQK
jgi:thiol-disulfide isomerase/thioredoxin